MTSNRHFFKQHGIRGAWIAIGILVLLTVQFLTINHDDKKEDEVITVLPFVRKNDETASAHAIAGTAKTTEVTIASKSADVKRPESESHIHKSYSAKEKASKSVAGMSPETLVSQAESTILQDDVTIEEKLAAIRTLKNIDDPIIINPAMLAMDDPDPNLRVAALQLVKDLDCEELNGVLLLGLEDDHPEVIEKTLRIMAKSDSPTILPSLEQALLDDDERLQRTAVLTLEDISDVKAIDILIESGLRNGNKAIHEDIFDSLEFITYRRFDSYQDARMWWDLNRDTFEFD